MIASFLDNCFSHDDCFLPVAVSMVLQRLPFLSQEAKDSRSGLKPFIFEHTEYENEAVVNLHHIKLSAKSVGSQQELVHYRARYLKPAPPDYVCITFSLQNATKPEAFRQMFLELEAKTESFKGSMQHGSCRVSSDFARWMGFLYGHTSESETILAELKTAAGRVTNCITKFEYELERYRGYILHKTNSNVVNFVASYHAQNGFCMCQQANGEVL